MKFADGKLAKIIGVQVDVTKKTEGACSAFADGAAGRYCRLFPLTVSSGSGVPLLVKFDARLKDSLAGPVGEIVQVWLPASVCCAALTPGVQAVQDGPQQIPASRSGLDLATTLERIQQVRLAANHAP